MWVTTQFSYLPASQPLSQFWLKNLCPLLSRRIWPPCLHGQRFGGSWKVGRVRATDHQPVRGGAFTLLHHLHPQGEQHGGIQEDWLSLNCISSSILWAVHNTKRCPYEKTDFTLPCPPSLSAYYPFSVLRPSFLICTCVLVKDVAAACSVYTDVNISLKQYFISACFRDYGIC